MFSKYIDLKKYKGDAEDEHAAIRDFLHSLEKSPDFETRIKELTFQHERFTDKRLNIEIGNVKLDNPLMVGPGWDKPAHAVRALYHLGFGGVEVGSIMQFPQEGNPKPRHFMLAPGVPLNRYGFNSPGLEVTAKNLEKYKNLNIPIGINIGKNKIIPDEKAPETYAAVAERLYEYGHYFVINVSSPNTPGLRKLQDKEPLIKIVKSVIEALDSKGGNKPIFVKIAPDMTMNAVDDVIDVVLENKLTGIIATNTTMNSDIKGKYGENWKNEMGGVSGDDSEFRQMSTDIIKHIYKQAGKKLTIIGVGGIKDTETALEKIKAGTTAIQVVAALDAEGPELPGKINRGIVKYLEKEGVKSIKELIGVDVK